MRVGGPNVVWWCREPDLDAALRRAVNMGLSAREAAEQLGAQFGRGITRNMCIGRATRLGLSFHGRKVKRIEETPA